MKKVSLKEKTYEELRKIASKHKIEGRSKMNKNELIKALQKTMKKKDSTKTGGGSFMSRAYQKKYQ
jgi:transcription termination factor Rho